MIERFYQDNKVKDIRIGDKRILRVLNQGKAVYPNVVRDGLVLHYDFRGYTNDNLKRGIAYDLSGNGNHGELKNFAYTEGSGYDGQGLVFDGVDDYIQLPTLGLDADDFTVMMNDKIFSYRGEDVAQVVDGSVEIGGRNLVQRSDEFNVGHNSADGITSSLTSEGYLRVVSTSGNRNWVAGWAKSHTGIEDSFNEGDQFTISFTMKSPDHTKIPTIYLKRGMGYYPLQGVMSTKFSTFYYSGIWKKAYSLSFHLGFSEVVGTTIIKNWKIEKGNKATDWTPAPEYFTTTQNQKPFFGDDIKTLLYWNRALSDSEILKMYNLYKNN